jgi:chemotaxis methyl-accepting protein methylase
VIAVTSENEFLRQLDPTSRRMSLEGLEALELYGAQMEHNLDVLAQQAALLQAALVERTEVMRRIVACVAAQEELLREIASSRKIFRGMV